MTDAPPADLHGRYYFIPQLFAVFVVAPLAWFVFFDRTPPLELYDGRMIPSVVTPGQPDVQIVWRAHFSGRDCDGQTQRELVDAKRNLWPKYRRNRRGVFHPSAKDAKDGIVSTPPLAIPAQMEPGPATYQVTQFYYCNPLQRWLGWPIIQKSVPIPFTVVGEPTGNPTSE